MASDGKTKEKRRGLSEEELSSFDYLRFTWTDMHGISRSKVVPKRNAQHMWEHGALVFSGSPGFGTRAEVPSHAEVLALEYGNMKILPDPGTFHVVPWAGGKDARIAQVLCDGYWIQTGQRHEVDTRHIARRMIDQLHSEFGLKCLMAWEYEFFLVDPKTLKPVFEGFDIYATQLIAQFEPFLCKLESLLAKTGIDVEYFITEYASGQFEFPTVPKFGLEAADKGFLLKAGVKEISMHEGYKAVFMTRPFRDLASNGLHFNHSLWDEAGNNAFFDDKSADNMSETFRHWIGGIFKHFKALVALCMPTTNCYRRLYQPWAPVAENWGIDNRMASFRAKNYDKQNTYLENRLPSGSANPYLVVAATLAAGMDGLRNHIEPPAQNDPNAPRVTGSLDEALVHLEEDEVLKEALGEVMVRWFTLEKRTIEIPKVNCRDNDEEKHQAEMQLYFEYL